MALACTRCESSGFLNLHQIEDDSDIASDAEKVLAWIKNHTDHDVQVCDCCGDGEEWHGVPGEHYNENDPQGQSGPYAYNGGLCECH